MWKKALCFGWIISHAGWWWGTAVHESVSPSMACNPLFFSNISSFYFRYMNWVWVNVYSVHHSTSQYILPVWVLLYLIHRSDLRSAAILPFVHLQAKLSLTQLSSLFSQPGHRLSSVWNTLFYIFISLRGKCKTV